MLAMLEVMRVEMFPRETIKGESKEYAFQELCENRRHRKEIDYLNDLEGL